MTRDPLDAARAQARAATLRESGGQLLDAEIRAQAAGRLDDEQRAHLLEHVDPTRFLTADGDIDARKVTRFLDAATPAGEWTSRRVPDLGQGRRGGPSSPSKSGKGLEEARRRFGKTRSDQ